MAQISRPVGYGLLAFASVAVLLFSNQSSPPPSLPPTLKPHRAAASAVQADFIAEDYTAHFDKPKGKLRNLFLPLAENRDDVVLPLAHQDLDTVPAVFASGESNWKYTGMAEINGLRSALLQDTEKHHGGFVSEGQHWKSCKVSHITGESVVLIDAQGHSQVVMRFSPTKPKTAAGEPAATVAPPQPVNPFMHGPIGPNNLVISPMPPMPPGMAGQRG